MNNSDSSIQHGRLSHLMLCTLSACFVVMLTGSSFLNEGAINFVAQQQAKKTSEKKSKSTDEEEPKEIPLEAWEKFAPDFEDHDLDGTEERAWEYRPYKVAVWFCLDGSPILDANYQSMAYEVTKRSELMDGSGWDLATGLAPPKYRSRFLQSLDSPEDCISFEEVKRFENFDKLMIVCLESQNARIVSRVREFDIQTQQWGPIDRKVFRSVANLGTGIANSIAVSFMPLVRIDRVDEIEYEDEEGRRRLRDEVVMQVRAVKSCLKTALVETSLLPEDLLEKYGRGTQDQEGTEESPGDSSNSNQSESSENDGADGQEEKTKSNRDDGKFTLIAEAAQSAPAFVNSSDRFLPVIRRTDKKGNLIKLEPIEFTFLTINELGNGVARAEIHSSARAPLSQRKSKRAQKLALVIRPPSGSTALRLTARDQKTAMEGFEIYSRKPGQTKDEASEFIGKTDWRGQLDIPPSKDGLRLIYVKRGARALKKIPIIPGLYSSVETTLPNDETRLYAEGVFNGLENEVLSLVIRRTVAEDEVAAAIKSGNTKRAREAMDNLTRVEKYSDLRTRLSNSASDLRFRANDNRERAYIDGRSTVLEGLIGKHMSESREESLAEQVLEMSESQRNAQSN